MFYNKYEIICSENKYDGKSFLHAISSSTLEKRKKKIIFNKKIFVIRKSYFKHVYYKISELKKIYEVIIIFLF